MVRNAASIQNLRTNLSEMNLSSSPRLPGLQPSNGQSSEQRELVTLGTGQNVQLCGQDARTKALMNRLATGQATEADRAEFNSQLQRGALPNNISMPYPQQVSQNNDHMPPPAQFSPRNVYRGLPVDNDRAMADYETQLAFLEKQNRAKKTQDSNGQGQATRSSDVQAVQTLNSEPVDVPREVSRTSPAINISGARHSTLVGDNTVANTLLERRSPPAHDYQAELTMLEQQNKRRLMMARREYDGLATQSQTTSQQQVNEMLREPDSGASLTEAKGHAAADFEGPKWQPDSESDDTRSGASKGLLPVPRAPIVGTVPTRNGNHALQDYQMQLQLLEQQKKEQERRRLRALYGEVSGPDFDVVGFMNQEEPPVFNSSEWSADFDARKEAHSQISDSIKDKWSSMDGPQRFPKATGSAAGVYCQPFCDFLTDNPTVFHAVDSAKSFLKGAHWTELNEREAWDLKPSGKYFVERNGSSLIAFVVGANYEPGNGAAILAGHVDALCAKLKPVSEVPNNAGYLQLGVAPYAGAMSNTWWDRDLGIGGRVLVKDGTKIVTKLVKLDRPIARIPSLAPHFGAAAQGPFNKETQMTPVIGLEDGDSSPIPITKGAGAFVSKQPPALVRAIGNELGLSEQTYSRIVNWELELFDVQPATVGGLNKEFIYGGRIDDKLCSWAAMQALTGSALYDTRFSSLIKVVAWFDNEEIGSQLRQGANSNFLPHILERTVGSLSKHHPSSDLMGRTYANSFLVSSDVTHAVNPNFLDAYLRSASPRLNTGLVVCADANGHMTTDAVSTSILQRCAERVGAKLQLFQIRNDSRSGGTVGPMLSSMTGIRAIDAGLPQLSMHSIRATTGSLDPGLGVLMFTGFLNGFEHVDKEFR